MFSFHYFNIFLFGGSDRIRTYFVYPEGTVLQTVVTPPSSAALPNYFKAVTTRLELAPRTVTGWHCKPFNQATIISKRG